MRGTQTVSFDPERGIATMRVVGGDCGEVYRKEVRMTQDKFMKWARRHKAPCMKRATSDYEFIDSEHEIVADRPVELHGLI